MRFPLSRRQTDCRAAPAGNKPSHLGITAVAAMTALCPRLTGLRPRFDRCWSRYIALRNDSFLLSQAGCRGRSPRRGYSVSPAMLSEGLTCLSKEGAGNPWFPPGVQGESPCLQKRWRVGRWDNGAGQTEPSVEGQRWPQQDHPSSRRILSLPPYPAEGEKAAPSIPQAGCRGRSPRRGYSVSPCSGKRWRAVRAG